MPGPSCGPKTTTSPSFGASLGGMPKARALPPDSSMISPIIASPALAPAMTPPRAKRRRIASHSGVSASSGR